MSDIGGPPPTEPVRPRERGDGSPTTSRDGTGTGGDPLGRESGQQPPQTEPLQSRDPAVSISATTAQLNLGEVITSTVKSVDAENRPVIENDRATFALKPDAGLKANDAVKLRVVDTREALRALLIEKNGSPIPQPPELALTITALKAPPANAPLPQDGAQAPATPATTYAGLTAQVREGAAQTRPLVPVRPIPFSTTAFSPALEVVPAARPVAAAGISLPVAVEPASLVQRAANPQAEAGPNPSAAAAYRTTAVPTLKAPLPAYGAVTRPIQLASLPQSLIASIAAGPRPELSQATPEGIPAQPPTLTAFRPDGTAQPIRLIDTLTSQIEPARAAEVLTVTPLGSDQARTLRVPLQLVQNAPEGLARVETTRGALILPTHSARTLVGEVVELVPVDGGRSAAPPSAAPQTAGPSLSAPPVQSATAFSPTESAAQPPAPPVYDARFFVAGERPESVTVQFAGSPQSGGEKILSVQTLHTVVAPGGPKADVRIGLASGELLLTLPTNGQPEVGGFVTFLNSAILPQSAGIQEAPVAEALASGLASLPPVVPGREGEGWPSLEAASLLDPGVQASLAARTAGGGGQMGNALLFMLTAAGRGAPDAWMGADARTFLSDKHPKLLNRLREDINRLFQLAGPSTAGEWRAVQLPFDLRAGDLQFMHMLFRREDDTLDPDAGGGGTLDGETDEETTRFLIGVTFELLGPVHLDGRIKGQRFDLCLTAEGPLSENLKADLRNLFLEALEANGFKGGLVIKDEALPELDAQALLLYHAETEGAHKRS